MRVILATPKVAAIAIDGAGERARRAEGGCDATLRPRAPEPVTAYVRDAERGEVTVMFGKNETTYRDPSS